MPIELPLGGAGAHAADCRRTATFRLVPMQGLADCVIAILETMPAEEIVAKDPLTGLPDRLHLGRVWARWLNESLHGVAALFIDLDGFKGVNDRFGHRTGDAVLQELAQRWQRLIREGDVLARYGGDEFVVLLRDVRSQEHAEAVARRFVAETAKPVPCGNDCVVQIVATIGAAFAPAAAGTLEDVIEAADRAMYQIKSLRAKK